MGHEAQGRKWSSVRGGAERKGTKIRRKTGVPVEVLLEEVEVVAALVEAHAAPSGAQAAPPRYARSARAEGARGRGARSDAARRALSRPSWG